MTNNSSTYFRELNLKEKQSKLDGLGKLKGEVIVWQKGNPKKETYSVSEFKRNTLDLYIDGVGKSGFHGLEILYSFQINGLSFFGKSVIKNISKGQHVLICEDTLFKCERRLNFRLLTYPHHDVSIQIELNALEKNESNLFSMNTGMTQTGIFNNFLEIVGSDNEIAVREGFSSLRVLDISVTGLSFIVGELEKEILDGAKEVGVTFLNFNGDEMSIPKGEIRYIVDMLGKDPNTRTYKVGFKFLEVDESMDKFLGQKINEAIRDFDVEFEDFIK